MAFLVEADRLKHINRATTLVDGSRPENSGEHSWHLALYALVLADQAGPGVNIDRVVRMLILHDLVEIDAGDTPIHGDYDPIAVAQAEEAAADRIFGILPGDIGGPLRDLWNEFEAAQTPDAVFAKSLDRAQPVVHILQNDGRGWRDYGVQRAGFLRARRQPDRARGAGACGTGCGRGLPGISTEPRLYTVAYRAFLLRGFAAIAR